jgi:hypothetical protein
MVNTLISIVIVVGCGVTFVHGIARRIKMVGF